MTHLADAHTVMDEEVLVHRIPHPSSCTPFKETSVRWIGWSWAVARVVERWAREEQIDVVEFPEYGAEGFVYQTEMAERRTIPVVVMLHGSLAMFSERSGWPPPGTTLHRVGSWLENASIDGADLLLAASQNIADFWTRRKQLETARIHVLGTAVDDEVFVPQRRGGSRPTVLFVGRISPDKGVLAVAQAVGALRSRYENIVLKIVGEGPADVTGEVIALAGHDHVELLGHVPHAELVGLYREADLFAAPASGEHGIASVYLEAMACGRAVVAGDCGGPPEAVVDGETGLLVPPGDPIALVGALDRLLGDAALRESMGVRGRQLVESRFSVASYAARAEQEYETLITMRSAR